MSGRSGAVGGDPLSQPPFARLYAEVPSANGETVRSQFLSLRQLVRVEG